MHIAILTFEGFNEIDFLVALGHIRPGLPNDSEG